MKGRKELEIARGRKRAIGTEKNHHFKVMKKKTIENRIRCITHFMLCVQYI